MRLRRLLEALKGIERDAPHLLEQDCTVVTDDVVYSLVLVNVYGDSRVTFIYDFEREGDNDGRTVDAE